MQRIDGSRELRNTVGPLCLVTRRVYYSRSAVQPKQMHVAASGKLEMPTSSEKKNKLRCNGCYRMRFTKDGIFILCAVQGDLQLTVQKTHNNSKISSHPERLTGRFVCVCARARVFSHP